MMQVGNYRIVEELARGGMGSVYVAIDETLKREVALKSIRSERRFNAESRVRFLQEARTLSRLDHPNICRIHAFIQHEDQDYLVLELIRGRTLSQALDDGMDAATRMRIARQIAEVLTVTHAEGIVHRDLKPGNVMLTAEGQVKVLDFGLARTSRDDDGEPGNFGVPESTLESQVDEPGATVQETMEIRLPGPGDPPTPGPGPADPGRHTEPTPMTRIGSVIGTPLYMSPEQARGKVVGTASDMYSLGLLLQILFTGRPPHPSSLDRNEIHARARDGISESVEGIDGDLTRLITRLKSKAPGARPTAEETARELAHIADKGRRRLRRVLAAAVTIVVALSALKYVTDLRRERAIAVAAEQEAEGRRDQAETLIGFMLGDLRNKLEGVGRLDILEDIGARAEDYFRAIPAEKLSSEELSRRSESFGQMGEVRLAQGDLSGALEAFRLSLAYADTLGARGDSDGQSNEELLRRSEALSRIGQARLSEGALPVAAEAFHAALSLALNRHARLPDDPDGLARLGEAHFWVGYVHWQQAELDSALAQFERYLETSTRLVELEPASQDWQLELLYGHSNIGSVLQARGDRKRAVVEFEKVIELNQELCDANPEDFGLKFEMAITHNTLGLLLEEMGDLDGAAIHYGNELKLKERLVSHDPANGTWLLNLARARYFAGRLAMYRGRLPEADEHCGKFMEIARNLATLSPDQVDWVRERPVALRQQAILALEKEDAASAVSFAVASLAEFDRIASRDTLNVDWIRERSQIRCTLSRALLGTGRIDEARAEAAGAWNALATLPAEADHDFNLAALVSAGLIYGESLAAAGEHAAARKVWSAVLEIGGADQPETAALPRCDATARTLLHLGRTAEAGPWIHRLQDARYQRPEFVRATARVAP